MDKDGLAHFTSWVKERFAGKQDALTPDETIILRDGGISVATPVKSLTQAEYDVLAEEEKQADAIYLVDEPPWTPAQVSIQEYDTDDGWHVRKWSDGYVEMVFDHAAGPYTEASWSAWDGAINTIVCLGHTALPVSLKKKLTEFASIINEENTFGWLMQESKTDYNPLMHTMRYLFCRPSTTYGSVTISIYVSGFWK
ncbi:MAG: hypothetical protein HFF84_12295 [Oscillibacter sp.]|nr:hypothetical protein [Oscillibacter sp.]